MRPLFLTLAAAGAFAAATSSASAQTIACPLTDALRTITTPLPSDWWTTPVVAALSETRVAEVAGRSTLQCVYGNAGTIARYAPDGQRCTATAGGFNCTAAVPIPLPLTPLPAAPVTRATGPIEWPSSYQVDLDTGALTTTGADLWYQAVRPGEAYITTVNGARIGAAKLTAGGKAGCDAETLYPASVPVAAIRIGSYVCVQTSDGRTSEFRLNNLRGDSPQTWSIGFTTWE